VAAEQIDVTLEGLYQLHARIGRRSLASGDYAVFGALVQNLTAKTEARIARLKAKAAANAAPTAAAQAAAGEDKVIDVEYSVSGGDEEDKGDGTAGAQPEGQSADAPRPDAEPKGTPTHPPPGATSAGNTGTAPGGAAEPETDSAGRKKPENPKGHGRNGASAYANAKHFFHKLMLGTIGSLCTCGDGRMRSNRERVTIRVIGQPLFAAEAHHYEQARCKMCNRIVTAPGPEAVLQGVGSKYVVYDWSACALLIVMHYFAGAPFKRLESLHAGWKVPFADANQWDVVNKSDDHLKPLFNALERVGMRTATSLGIDDTGGVVLSILRQLKAEIAALKKLGESTDDVRNGVNATGVYLEIPDGVVILYYTGLHHAGEIFDRLMKHRQAGDGPLVKVTDGASKNFDHTYDAELDELIEAVCNAHCYLKWLAIKDKHPVQYAVAGEVYKKVFDNDDIAKKGGMTPAERMAYHAEHSRPLMEKLKAMCVDLLAQNLVEPKSALWGPVSFVINQWRRLTKFYEKPGVPLHTNLVEQILITVTRYLAGSFNYQTPNGAEVGDRHMSLIASAKANDVEPVAYLEHCLRNHEDLAKRPEYYLPWVYRDRMKQLDSPLDAIQIRVVC
jgi:transposase